MSWGGPETVGFQVILKVNPIGRKGASLPRGSGTSHRKKVGWGESEALKWNMKVTVKVVEDGEQLKMRVSNLWQIQRKQLTGKTEAWSTGGEGILCNSGG